MQRLKIITLALALLLVGACSATGSSSSSTSGGTSMPSPTPSSPHFITFSEFIASLDTATFADYAKLPGAMVQDATAFETMRAYIKQLYAGVKQVSSFIADGQYTDCITIQTQPSVLQQGIQSIAAAPTNSANDKRIDGQSPGVPQFGDSILDQGKVDAFGNSLACPSGTIPMERVTLERMTQYKTLHDFLAKGPDGTDALPPLPNQDITPGGPHRYAHAYQSVTNYGGDSWLNLWNPSGPFSLSQQWYSGGSPVQTVEGGWVVYPKKFSSQAVLFIYWTADGYNKTGCYNLECSGFVQTNNHWYLGGTWTNYSSSGGTQWGFELQWKLYSGNWWLFLKGPGSYEAVGYLPTSVYSGGQLATNATTVDYGGETFDDGTGTWPQMGSGQFASAGWQQAAFQKTVFYIPRDENDGVGIWTTLNPVQNTPKCYTIAVTPFSSGGDWGTYFFFGGPGGSC